MKIEQVIKISNEQMQEIENELLRNGYKIEKCEKTIEKYNGFLKNVYFSNRFNITVSIQDKRYIYFYIGRIGKKVNHINFTNYIML